MYFSAVIQDSFLFCSSIICLKNSSTSLSTSSGSWLSFGSSIAAVLLEFLELIEVVSIYNLLQLCLHILEASSFQFFLSY